MAKSAVKGAIDTARISITSFGPHVADSWIESAKKRYAIGLNGRKIMVSLQPGSLGAVSRLLVTHLVSDR